MKKLKPLVDVIREFNGLVARTKKDPNKENKDLLEGCLVRLKDAVNEVLV